MSADDALLLVRRPEDGLLGGLWEIPGRPLPDDLGALVDRLGGSAAGTPLEPVAHTFSHKRVTYRPVAMRVERTDAAGVELRPDRAWVGPERLEDYALPVAQRKIARAVVDLLRRRQLPVRSR